MRALRNDVFLDFYLGAELKHVTDHVFVFRLAFVYLPYIPLRLLKKCGLISEPLF